MGENLSISLLNFLLLRSDTQIVDTTKATEARAINIVGASEANEAIGASINAIDATINSVEAIEATMDAIDANIDAIDAIVPPQTKSENPSTPSSL